MTFADWQTWVFLGSIGFLAIDHFRLRDKVAESRTELSNLRTHVAENYVRSPEVVRLSDEISTLRRTVEEAVKLLHEIKGSQHQ